MQRIIAASATIEIQCRPPGFLVSFHSQQCLILEDWLLSFVRASLLFVKQMVIIILSVPTCATLSAPVLPKKRSPAHKILGNTFL